LKKTLQPLKITITALAVICLFACNDNLSEVRKMSISSNEPLGDVKNLALKHTDSGRLKVILTSKKMLDFSNDRYPYTVFPDGLQVDLFNDPQDSTRLTVITADYGVMYSKTKLVDLRGNVKIVSDDGTTFTGEQLYWDQKAAWLFTDKNSKAVLPNGSVTTSQRLDANQNLEQVRARDTYDTFKVNQN